MTKERKPNVGKDPINPAYYAGTTCAEIIEHMPTNVGFATKYAWRLGEKDSEHQESGKAIWYLKRELIREPQYYGLADDKYLKTASEKGHIALQQGKLDHWRFQVVMECIHYTVTADPDHLKHAIILFEQYGLNPNEDNKQ